jgi:hypothetical protein
MMGTNKKLPKSFTGILDNGEKKEVFIKTWKDHVMDQDEIKSFTTIVGNQLYHIELRKDEVLIPYTEHHGDHEMNYILILNVKTNQEISRKNIRTVDMIDWKLSSS